MENQRDTEHRLRRKSGAVLSMFFWKRPRDGGKEKEGRDCERDSWRNRSLHYRSSRRDRVPRGEEARKGTQGITPRNDTQCSLWPVSVPHSHLFNVTCNIMLQLPGDGVGVRQLHLVPQQRGLRKKTVPQCVPRLSNQSSTALRLPAPAAIWLVGKGIVVNIGCKPVVVALD